MNPAPICVPRETLAQLVGGSAMCFDDACRILASVAHELARMHAAGERHERIEPEAIVLRFTEAGAVSSSTLASPPSPPRRVASTRSPRRPPASDRFQAFAAPEHQARLLGLGGDMTEAADVYALAATLLWAIVGESRYPGGRAQSLHEVARAYERRARSPLHPDAVLEVRGDARRRLEACFTRWLGAPAQRPTAAAFARELEALAVEHDATGPHDDEVA